MNTNPITLKELVADIQRKPEEYSHLQFILSRHELNEKDLGKMYLVVNTCGFGLYRLDEVDYKNGEILLSFTNPVTGNMAELNVDIKNKHPQVFLVNWKDIEDMMYVGRVDDISDNELLELEVELL